MNLAKIYDVTMPITETMPVYKNKPEKRPQFEITSDHPSTGNGVRETRIHIDVHTGTHIDAPLHMLKGAPTMESIPLERLVCPCRVVNLEHVSGGITGADLEPLSIERGEFLVIKTKNSADTEFNFDFVYIAEDGARFLVERGIAGVAVDALGVERSQPGHETHEVLFGADVVVIEGLRLADVPEGRYQLVALPLRLVGLDASPARVILIEEATPQK